MASILLNELDEMYKKKTAADMASLDSAFQQNVSGVENTRSKITPEFTDARNQVAGQSAVQQGNFNERANATGLNSGAAGQAALAFGTTLQNNLGALNKQEASALSDLDLQLNNIKSQYAIDAARLQADGDWQALNAKYQQMQADEQAAKDQARYDKELELQSDATAYDRAVDRANASKNFNSMAAFGWTPEEIASANAAANKVTGSGGSGTSASDKLYSKAYGEMMNIAKLYADEDGGITPEGIAALQSYATGYYGDIAGQLMGAFGASMPQDTTPTYDNSNIDLRNINSLGFGPISIGTLKTLVDSGKVVGENVNGKTIFRKITQGGASPLLPFN